DALKQLACYYWRGNVRELENCIERAMVMADGNVIDAAALPDRVRASASGEPRDDEPVRAGEDENLSIKQRSRALEIELIRKALKKTGGNRTHAARILEISHRALLYKLKEYE